MKIDRIIYRLEQTHSIKGVDEFLAELYSQNNMRLNKFREVKVKIHNMNFESLLDFLKTLKIVLNHMDKNDDEMYVIIHQINKGCGEIVLAVASFILELLSLIFEIKSNRKYDKLLTEIKNDIRRNGIRLDSLGVEIDSKDKNKSQRR